MSSFHVIALRKFVTGSLIAILFLSSLSFAVTTQVSNETQRETEKPSVVVDTGPSESNVEPEPEPELQDSTESTEEIEQQIPAENEEQPVPAQNWIPWINWIPWWTFINLDGLGGQQNKSESAQNEGPQLPAENEVPEDDDGGTVKAVGVAMYSDISISDPLVSIDWGELRPGGNKTVQCYIQNTGETAEVLTLQTDNWTPSSATEYMALTWDYDGEPLNINEVIPVNLTLAVSVNIEGITTFFFDITVIGSNIE